MNNRFKFRIWDDFHESLGKKFFYSEDVGLHIFFEWINNHGNKLEKIGQFTGLTDKNGREIYEGDIVSQDAPHDCEWIGKVVYEVDRATFRVNITNHMKNICEYCPITKYWTVIGNVWENSELLK